MSTRPISADDFPAVAALLRDDEEHLNGRPSHVGESELHEWTSAVDLPKGSWLFADEGGITAVGWAWTHADVTFGIGAVHPRAKGVGLGSRLVDRSERVGRESGLPRMHQYVLASDTAAAALMTGRGYRDVRHFCDMAIELEVEPEVPRVAIETMRAGDKRAFHAALEEALWFVVRDGDEIVAIARSEANRNGGGYVGHLAVRAPWRGRGYAKALLLHTFREFWDRGFRRVTLGVDAASPTGATHLYERVGMHVEAENVVFEKALAA